MSEAKPVAIPVGQDAPADVTVHGTAQNFRQEIESGRFRLQADEPESVGGNDSAPTPYDYLLAALGACTSMTIGLYARKKKWPLEDVAVSLHHSRIHAKDCADCETKEGMLDQIKVHVDLKGPLSDEQRAKLLEIAGKCPVHRTLKSEIAIDVQPATAKAT